MRSSKASKEAKQPDKEAQQEQKLILKDVRDKMFRAAVVPAAYSVEEFLLGMCKFDEIRMKTIKLTEDEVGYGQYAMRNLGKRIMSAYFKPNPKLFEEIFGFPMSELKEEGLLCMRPWHDEVIMVMAPPKPPMRCFYNSIIRETLSSNDQSRVSWTGNLLCLSSSLQSEICPDLGGLTRYALNGLLQEKLGKAAAPALEAAWKSKQAGLDMQKQFGWIKDLPQPGPPAPPASAPLDTHLEFMITGWKQTRCLLPYRHPPDKCTGYHVMAAGVNSNTMVFDARRPPVGKDGSVLYQPEWCRSGPDVSVREGKDTAYYSCPTGPSCNKAHSRLELFYHPGFFKHEKCEGVSGGKCSCQEAGTPEYICAFWHSRAETNALSAILPRFAPSITPPWEARDRAWDDSSEDEQTPAAAAAAVPAAAAGSNGVVGSSVATSADGLSAATGAQQGLLAGEGSSGWAGLSVETSGTSAAAADEVVGVGDPEGVFALEGVDMEALRYLYYGPPDNQDLVEWFYVDPNQDIQGPFSAADMFSWCSQGLLPLNLPLHPGTGDGVRPQALDEFWPMHTLLGMAAEALKQQQEAAAAAAAAAAMAAAVPEVQPAGAAQPSTPQPVSPAATGAAAGGGFSSSAPQSAATAAAARRAAVSSTPAAPTASPVVAAVAVPVFAPVVVPAAVQPASAAPATASPAKQPLPAAAAAAAAATAAMAALRPSSAGLATAGGSSGGDGTMTRGLSSSSLSAAAAAYDPTRPAAAAAAAAGVAAASAATAALTPRKAPAAAQNATIDSSRDSSAVSTGNAGYAKVGPGPPAAAAVEQPALGSSGVRLSKLALNVNAPAFTYKPGGSSAAGSVNSATATPTAAQAADKAAGSADAGSSIIGPAQQQQQQLMKESKRLAIKPPTFSPLGPSGHSSEANLQDAAAASAAKSEPAAATADAQPSSAADTAAAAAAVVATSKEAGSRPLSANSVGSASSTGKAMADAAAKSAAGPVPAAAALPSPGSLEFGTISSSIIEQMERHKQQAAAAAAAVVTIAAADDGAISSSAGLSTADMQLPVVAVAAAPAGAEETAAVRTQDTAPQQQAQHQQQVPAGTDQGPEYDGGGNPYALLSAAEDASDNDKADMEQLAAAAAKTAAAAANSSSRPSSASGTGFFPARIQAGRFVQVSIRMFDSQAPNPKDSVYTVSGTHPGEMTGAQLMEHVIKSGQSGVSSSSSSPWSSVMLMWVRPGRPYPSLRLLQPTQTLGELLQEFSSSSSSSGTESNQLLFEAYCSRDGAFDSSNPRNLPLLHRLVYCGGSLKYKLEAVVDFGTAAGGGRAVTKLDQVMMILEKSFEAAVHQGLLWRHDVDWAVFNTGLRRADDGSPQLLFCSRRTWQPHHTAAPVSAPWVASNKLEDAAGVQHWMKGAVPPVPVLPDSVTAATSSSSSRGTTPLPPAAGAAGRSWRPSDNGYTSPAAAAAVHEGLSLLRAPSAGAGAQQQQQQQQQQQAVLWPASTYAYGPSIVSRIGSSSFGYGHFFGAYIPSTLGSVAQQQQQQQLGPVPIHPVGQPGTWPAAGAGRGVFSMPLLSQPVLPTYPMPQGSGWGWAGSSSSSSSNSDVSQLQEQQMQQLSQLFKQHAVKPFRDLKRGQGPQLLIKCSSQGPVQQQQQQQQEEEESDGGVMWLLISQHTTAEEVSAALTSEWLTAEQGSSSSSTSLLLAYTSTDSSSGTTAWRLLQSAAVTALVDAPDSAGASIDTSSSSSSSRVQHPLGAQMPFPAVLECIDVKAYPLQQPAAEDGAAAAAASSVLSPLVSQCICWDSAVATSTVSSSSSNDAIGQELLTVQQLCQQLQVTRSQPSSGSSSGERQMLSEVASLAAAEHWGPGYRILGQYISSNFYRAAVQGRLMVKTFSSNSSSNGGDDVRGSSESGVEQQVLLFNTGLVTEAGQHVLMLFLSNSQQQQQQGCDDASQDAQQDRPLQPWLYLGCATSYDCAALQPLPAPAAAPVAAFNPHLPLQVDVDALSASVKSSYRARPDLEPRQQRRRLQILQSLKCGGYVLPAEAAEAVIHGGIAKSLLLLQRTPQLACQVLVEGERLMYALPLMVFAGEPVCLVLLLELYTAPQISSSSSSETVNANGVPGAAPQQQQQQCGVLYCSQGVARFADVYPCMRALGPCDWVSWVKEAVAAMQL